MPGSDWALSQAKHNLVHQYLVVGVTEEMEQFVALLQAALPRLFRGALLLYQQGMMHLFYTLDESSVDFICKNESYLSIQYFKNIICVC